MLNYQNLIKYLIMFFKIVKFVLYSHCEVFMKEDSTQNKVKKQIKFIPFLDDKSKCSAKWWNKNYFFIGSIFFILLNIILFAIFGGEAVFDLDKQFTTDGYLSDEFNNFILCFCGNFTHADWEHVLQNMLGISVCLLYMERKLGTFNLLGMLVAITAFCSFLYLPSDSSVCGSSIVWFACFGYVVVDYLFSFRKRLRNKTNIFFGLFVILLEFFRCGFYDDYSTGTRIIKWGIIPVQLSGGHAQGFLIGLCLCIIVNMVCIFKEKQSFCEK